MWSALKGKSKMCKEKHFLKRTEHFQRQINHQNILIGNQVTTTISSYALLQDTVTEIILKSLFFCLVGRFYFPTPSVERQDISLFTLLYGKTPEDSILLQEVTARRWIVHLFPRWHPCICEISSPPISFFEEKRNWQNKNTWACCTQVDYVENSQTWALFLIHYPKSLHSEKKKKLGMYYYRQELSRDRWESPSGSQSPSCNFS